MTTIDHAVLDDQRQHWQATFQANPGMYASDPSMGVSHE